MTGIDVSPAALAARKRRSPIMSSYLLSETLRTTGGCKIPTAFIEAMSSLSAVSSKTVRGWRGFGKIWFTGTSFC